MKKRRLLSLILAAVMASSLAACGGDSDVTDDTTPADTAASESNSGYKLNVPKREGDEEVITFLACQGYTENYKLIPENERGDVLDEAGHKRALAVSELLNVTYDKYYVPVDGSYNALNIDVMSGDGVYDFVLPHAYIGVASMVSDGLLLDWNELDYVDFSKPWWNSRMQESISIAGKMFWASGDITMTWQGMQGIVFNKSYLEEYKIDEDLYALAKDGKWTMDKMYELITDMGDDLGGDQKMDETDQYGFMSTHIGVSYQIAGGQPITKLDEDGCPVLDMGTERMIDIVDKYYRLMTSPDSYYAVYSSGDYETSIFRNILVEGRSFITALDLGSFYMKLRELDYDFGILPLPKFDENQETYNTATAAGIVGIPLNADPELCGMVAEALAYYSYEYVRPAFFDVVLQNKALRDEASYEMLTLMHESKYYDFGYNLTDAHKMLDAVVILHNNSDFASYYETQKDTINKGIRDIYEKLIEE